MHIATASHYHPPHVGGIEVVVAASADSAAAAGHRVTVLTSRAGGVEADVVRAGVTVVRCPAWNYLEERAGIPFPLFGLRYLRAARRAVAAADVVHVHDVFYLSSHITGLLALLHRKPLYVTQHVAMVEHPSRFVVAAQRAVYATIGRLLLSRAAAVVTYNAHVRELARRHGGGDRVVEVRNGIDLDVFTPADEDARRGLRRTYGVPDDRPVVLFVGRLVAKKGYDIVHAARRPEWLTVFVGDGLHDTGALADEDVLAIGSVDRGAIADWYRMADVFVLPAAGEVFTLTTQEAMACGLPVVTTDEPGYAEHDLADAGLQLVDRTPTDVGAAVAALVGDPERRARAGAAARRYAEANFSWDANIGEVLDLYEAQRRR